MIKLRIDSRPRDRNGIGNLREQAVVDYREARTAAATRYHNSSDAIDQLHVGQRRTVGATAVKADRLLTVAETKVREVLRAIINPKRGIGVSVGSNRLLIPRPRITIQSLPDRVVINSGKYAGTVARRFKGDRIINPDRRVPRWRRVVMLKF